MSQINCTRYVIRDGSQRKDKTKHIPTVASFLLCSLYIYYAFNPISIKKTSLKWFHCAILCGTEQTNDKCERRKKREPIWLNLGTNSHFLLFLCHFSWQYKFLSLSPSHFIARNILMWFAYNSRTVYIYQFANCK